MQIYDITATIGENLPVYVESERPKVEKLEQINKGDFCNLSRLTTITHAGTHADMPSHFITDGATNDTVNLSHFYGSAKLFRLSPTTHITEKDLAPLNIEAGDIILLDTGQSPQMSKPKLDTNFIALAPCAAEYLAAKKIKTLGIDCLSVDPYGSPNFPAHMVLLGNGITIIEGLVLDAVPVGTYILSALPLKIQGGDGSPVRAVLIAN